MKKISIWANKHKWTSRTIIALANIVLIFLGCVIGLLLPQASASLSVAIFFSLCVLTFYIWSIYSSVKRNYVKRKLCEFAVGFFTIGFAIIISNYGFPVATPQAYGSSTAQIDTTKIQNHPRLAIFKQKLENAKASKLSKKEKRRIVKTEIKSIMRDGELSGGEKALIITLTILLALAILAGTAALSCSLSCSGSGAGAALVVVAGLFLTIFVIAKGVQWANRERPKKNKTQD